MSVPPPNTRVQRTRVLAVARNARALWSLARSPLTRHPLGDVGRMRSPELHLPAQGFPVRRGSSVGRSSRGSWVVGRAASESVAFVVPE
jgi:hypothetical protein